jgi:hypothetical protein
VNRAALLLLLMLAGCKPDTSAVKFSGEQRHDNGLIAPQPEGFTMRETDSGFALEQIASLRNPLEMKLELKRDNFVIEQIGVTQWEGGSGGPVYVLSQVRDVGNCLLVLTANQQSETGEPSFVVAWAIFERAYLANTANC